MRVLCVRVFWHLCGPWVNTTYYCERLDCATPRPERRRQRTARRRYTPRRVRRAPGAPGRGR
eukprot:866808-Prymnesium_polylepis.1